MMLKDSQDAFGHLIYDLFLGKGGCGIVERDDGYVEADRTDYLSRRRDWPAHQREALRHAVGRVLDIGCGAGRHSLYLQKKGLDVLGTDNSPLAIKTCKRRGLRNAKVLSVDEVSGKLGTFDTIIMLGNNFGLLAGFKKARRLFKKFYGMTSANGRIIVEARDPHDTRLAEHLEYQRLNKRRGRMPGQVRLRLRYKKYATPWFDYLFVSRGEMRGILKDTGWRAERFLRGKNGNYIAIIGKFQKV